MGDFNIDIDNASSNRQYRTAKLAFIQQLVNLDLYDYHTLIARTSSSVSTHIWSNHDRSLLSSLDYTWCSISLLNSFIFYDSFKSNLYQSDHKQIIVFFDNQIIAKSLSDHLSVQKEYFKLKYNYDKMDDDL